MKIRPRLATPPLFAVLTVGATTATAQETAVTTEATEAQNRAVVSLFIEEFKNRENHDIVDELFTPDFAHHLKDPNLPPGREGMKFVGQGIVAGFPDVHVTVEDMLAEGDRVIKRITVHATHLGEFNDIPATGRQVTWTEIHIYRLEDGRIAELWSEVDLLSLLIQLGALGP